MQFLLRREEAGVICSLLFITVVFAIFSESFFTLRTFGSIATFASVLGVIAIGSCILMISGEFDLSVGSTTALCGMVFSMGVVNWEANTFLVGFAALAIGALVGFINGLVTIFSGIPSFITTLGTLLIWRGVVLAVSGGFPISLVEDRSGLLLWFGANLGNGFYTGALWWLGLAALFYWILKYHPIGNHIFATGGDPVAARGMGVRTVKIKLICFTLCGFLAGLAGLILFSQLQDLSPTAGESYELYAIAAAVIGGTLLTGGKGSILGAVLGTILIGTVQSGLVHAGAESYWFRTFVGIFIIVAVVLNKNLEKWMRVPA